MAAGLLAAASIGMVLLTWKGGNGSVVGINRWEWVHCRHKRVRWQVGTGPLWAEIGVVVAC